LNGGRSVAKCDTSAYGGPSAEGDRAPETPADIRTAWQTQDYPISQPYGEAVHLDDFIKIRMSMGAPASEIIGETNHDFASLKEGRDAGKFVEESIKENGGVLEGKAKIIYDMFVNKGNTNPHMVTAEVNSYLQPILEQCVENVKDPTSIIVDASPKVVDAHDTYSNPARFAAERKVLFEEGLLIVGLSSDVGEKNDCESARGQIGSRAAAAPVQYTRCSCANTQRTQRVFLICVAF
jgi:hypothetical protein